MKYKLCKKNRFIAIALATTTILTAGTFCYHRNKNDKIHRTVSSSIGYLDINPLTNQLVNKLTTNDFVLLNIGDHNNDGVYFLNQKLNYCKEHHINIGLILTPTKNTSLDFYLDLEFIKEMISQNEVTYPIYLDVDPIFSDPSITYQDARDLIASFLQKAQENHLYIGLYGKGENLEEYQGYHLYIKDNIPLETIYPVNSQEEYLTIPKEIIEEIRKKHYNDCDLLKKDEYFIYKDENSLKEIAKEYNLSINTILKYNQLHFSSPKETQILSIPSTTYQEKRHLNITQPTELGIDVSRWQATIQWQDVDIDFAIIQLRDFINSENDPMFFDNVQGCLTNNIPMGFYIFSRATTIEDLTQEINTTKKELKNIPVAYPIYLDLETDFWYHLVENTSEENIQFINNFIKTWAIEITKAGYTPGLYCNQSLYNRLDTITSHYLDNISCWIAGGNYYDTSLSIDDKVNLPEIENVEQVSMKQISSRGEIAGIAGDVDLNYYYVNGFSPTNTISRNFIRIDHEIKYGIRGIIGLGILLIARRRRKKKKTRNNYNK